MTHLASWTHKDASFILFPLADGNLDVYMKNNPRPRIDASFTLWLIRQIFGLTEALSQLHGPPLAQAGETISDIHVRIGFNHDLKPANILTLKEDKSIVLKWCDFGSGRINTVSSNRPPSPCTSNPGTGDPAYSAPELLTEGVSSRPKDIWSFGCLLLEILLWTFGVEPYFDLAWFKEERRRTPKGPEQGSSAFWYLNSGTGEICFKQPVQDAIEGLQRRCAKEDSFRPVLDLVLRMLTVEQRARPTAHEVSAVIAKILADVESAKT